MAYHGGGPLSEGTSSRLPGQPSGPGPRVPQTRADLPETPAGQVHDSPVSGRSRDSEGLASGPAPAVHCGGPRGYPRGALSSGRVRGRSWARLASGAARRGAGARLLAPGSCRRPRGSWEGPEATWAAAGPTLTDSSNRPRWRLHLPLFSNSASPGGKNLKKTVIVRLAGVRADGGGERRGAAGPCPQTGPRAPGPGPCCRHRGRSLGLHPGPSLRPWSPIQLPAQAGLAQHVRMADRLRALAGARPPGQPCPRDPGEARPCPSPAARRRPGLTVAGLLLEPFMVLLAFPLTSISPRPAPRLSWVPAPVTGLRDASHTREGQGQGPCRPAGRAALRSRLVHAPSLGFPRAAGGPQLPATSTARPRRPHGVPPGDSLPAPGEDPPGSTFLLSERPAVVLGCRGGGRRAPHTQREGETSVTEGPEPARHQRAPK